jgi:four helix bundle protein
MANNMPGAIHSFQDLVVWQKGHELVIGIYKITQHFPNSELFGLTSQIRRCVVSITSNIAEGFTRAGKAEKKQFYFIAKASLSELENQLLIARDIGYVSKEEYDMLNDKLLVVFKLLCGFIRGLEK